MANILKGSYKDMLDSLQEQAYAIEKMARSSKTPGSDELADRLQDLKGPISIARAAADKVVRAEARG